MPKKTEERKLIFVIFLIIIRGMISIIANIQGIRLKLYSKNLFPETNRRIGNNIIVHTIKIVSIDFSDCISFLSSLTQISLILLSFFVRTIKKYKI